MTSPLLLAPPKTKKPIDASQQQVLPSQSVQTTSPYQLRQDPNTNHFNVPSYTDIRRTDSEKYDPSLAWQKQDLTTSNIRNDQSQLSQITPAASSIPASDYMARFGPIKTIGETAAAGQIASSQTQAARAMQIKSNQLAALAANASNQAYVDANGVVIGQIDGGSYAPGDNGAGWGSGGAQGVANVLRAAGFPESAIPTMMAIAKAESSWNPAAVNNSNRNGSVDRGLFQINSIHAGNSWYPTDPFDPLQSAKAAFAIWQGAGQTYRDWSVYNSGAYKQFFTNDVPAKVTSAGTVSAGGGISTSSTSAIRQQVVGKAQNVIGLPYVWGGTSLSSGVDCSGLVQAVYQQLGLGGLLRGRQARDQAVSGQRVSNYNQLQPGDLIAFQWPGGYAGPNTVSHIAIYAGNGEIIEAAGETVRRRKLNGGSQDNGAIYVKMNF